MIFLLTRTGEVKCDENVSMVIRASCAEDARCMAAANCFDEKSTEWLDTKRSTCEPVSDSGPAYILCIDTKEG